MLLLFIVVLLGIGLHTSIDFRPAGNKATISATILYSDSYLVFY